MQSLPPPPPPPPPPPQSSSHLLAALPIELLVFIIRNLDRVEDVAALARTSRRLYGTANPYLYKRAAECHDARPLAWAANRGIVPTLRMALAAGLDPNHEFAEPLPADEWASVSAAARADAAAGRPRQPWAMWDVNNRPKPDAGDGGGSGRSGRDPSPRAAAGASDRASTAPPPAGDCSQRSHARPATEPSAATPRPAARMLTRRFYAMHLAARGGHEAVIEMLARHGAAVDVSSQRFCACTPLYGLLNALEHPEEEDYVDEGDEGGRAASWTPLHAAICHGRVGAAKLLLALKAAPLMETLADGRSARLPEARDLGYGATALHHAAGAGLAELVRHLLDAKILRDVDARDDRTLTPLYHAYAGRQWETTMPELLARGADMDCEAKMYIPYTAITPLGEACRLGDFAVADRLIELGADVRKGFQAYTKPGCLTPLHLCCMRSAQPPASARQRQQQQQQQERGQAGGDGGDGGNGGNGGDVNDDDETRGRARMRTIGKLIERGAPLDARDCFGSTPLMAAVQASNRFALEALSLHGAGPEHSDPADVAAARAKMAAPDPTSVRPR